MKFRYLNIIICTMIALTLLAPTRYVSAQDSESSASLKETLDWLKDKLIKFGRGPSRTGKFPDDSPAGTETFQPVLFNGCTITYKIIEEHEGNITWIHEVTVSLGDLDPMSITSEEVTQPSRKYYALNFGTFEKKKSVQYHFTSLSNGKVLREERDTSAYVWPLAIYDNGISKEGKDMSKRIVRALRHAITLCGGKTEPF